MSLNEVKAVAEILEKADPTFFKSPNRLHLRYLSKKLPNGNYLTRVVMWNHSPQEIIYPTSGKCAPLQLITDKCKIINAIYVYPKAECLARNDKLEFTDSSVTFGFTQLGKREGFIIEIEHTGKFANHFDLIGEIPKCEIQRVIEADSDCRFHHILSWSLIFAVICINIMSYNHFSGVPSDHNPIHYAIVFLPTALAITILICLYLHHIPKYLKHLLTKYS